VFRFVEARGTFTAHKKATAAGELGGPVTLICAPAGFGKSTLLAGWVQRITRPAWLSLDERDNELRAFMQALIAALQAVFEALQDSGGEPVSCSPPLTNSM
jgi:LuxR family maltose regulon positive regulatory protein